MKAPWPCICNGFEIRGQRLGLTVQVVITEGFEPVGYGIGPALEARDVVRVLQNHNDAPPDLREHALLLAGAILEFSPRVPKKQGRTLAADILASGKAWAKFQAICEAQGGMRDIPASRCQHDYLAPRAGPHYSDRHQTHRAFGQTGRRAAVESGGHRSACQAA